MSQEPNEVRVRYVYKKTDDLKSHFINGVYGGRTPQGEILCTFYFEHSILPDEDELVLKEGQTILKEPDLSNIILQRDFKVSIIMSPNQAKNIGDWLVKLGNGDGKPVGSKTDE